MSKKKAAPVPSPAEEYIASEIIEARKSISQIQIFGTCGLVAMTVILGGIANGFATNLEPKEAAKIVKGYAYQQLENGQSQLSDYLKEQIPSAIEQAPDYAMNQLVEYRTTLENDLQSRLESVAKDTSDRLDSQLDQYLDENKEEFKTLILSGQDKDTTDEVAQQTKNLLMVYLTAQGEDGESIQDKIDKSLAALKEVDDKTSKLAENKNLTPSEKQTRHAFAALFGAIEDSKGSWNLPSKEDIQNQVSALVPSQETTPADDSAATIDGKKAAAKPSPSAPAAALQASPAPAMPRRAKQMVQPESGPSQAKASTSAG